MLAELWSRPDRNKRREVACAQGRRSGAEVEVDVPELQREGLGETGGKSAALHPRRRVAVAGGLLDSGRDGLHARDTDDEQARPDHNAEGQDQPAAARAAPRRRASLGHLGRLRSAAHRLVRGGKLIRSQAAIEGRLANHRTSARSPAHAQQGVAAHPGPFRAPFCVKTPSRPWTSGCRRAGDPRISRIFGTLRAKARRVVPPADARGLAGGPLIGMPPPVLGPAPAVLALPPVALESPPAVLVPPIALRRRPVLAPRPVALGPILDRERGRACSVLLPAHGVPGPSLLPL